MSHPSARELAGTVVFVVNCATSSGENGGGLSRSPRAARRTTRANAPTAGAAAEQPRVAGGPAECGRVIVVHFAGERPAAARIFHQRQRRCGEPLETRRQIECQPSDVNGPAGADGPAEAGHYV